MPFAVRKREIEALREELRAARAASEELRIQADATARERDKLKQQNDMFKRDADHTRRIFVNLSGFGESVVALRESFADLSRLLGENRQTSEQTASESAASGQALQSIVQALNAMNSRISSADSFRRIEEPHREVHVQARAAVTHFHAGDHAAALNALAAMERANLDVMTRLRLVVRNV